RALADARGPGDDEDARHEGGALSRALRTGPRPAQAGRRAIRSRVGWLRAWVRLPRQSYPRFSALTAENLENLDGTDSPSRKPAAIRPTPSPANRERPASRERRERSSAAPLPAQHRDELGALALRQAADGLA